MIDYFFNRKLINVCNLHFLQGIPLKKLLIILYFIVITIYLLLYIHKNNVVYRFPKNKRSTYTNTLPHN